MQESNQSTTTEPHVIEISHDIYTAADSLRMDFGVESVELAIIRAISVLYQARGRQILFEDAAGTQRVVDVWKRPQAR